MIERLASFIKKELSVFLRENISLEIGVFISVTHVFIDDSLERAQVYVSVFPEKFSAEIFKELKLLQKDSRKFLARRVGRHKIPGIKFILDKNLDAESHIEKLLKK
jgi:ribosome-binding factor A